MTIEDLYEQFEIQGEFHIKVWDDVAEDYVTLAKGSDFGINKTKIDEEVFKRNITYMYATMNDGLNIEVE